jgi:hypothetical protein
VAVDGRNTNYGFSLEGLGGDNFGHAPLPEGRVGFFHNTPVKRRCRK